MLSLASPCPVIGISSRGPHISTLKSEGHGFFLIYYVGLLVMSDTANSKVHRDLLDTKLPTSLNNKCVVP